MINSGNLHSAMLSLCYSYGVLLPSVFLQCYNTLHLFTDCCCTTGLVAHYCPFGPGGNSSSFPFPGTTKIAVRSWLRLRVVLLLICVAALISSFPHIPLAWTFHSSCFLFAEKLTPVCFFPLPPIISVGYVEMHGHSLFAPTLLRNFALSRGSFCFCRVP